MTDESDDLKRRLRIVETQTALSEQAFRDLNRTLDHLLPHGEQLAEVRTLLATASNDISWLRTEAASIRVDLATAQGKADKAEELRAQAVVTQRTAARNYAAAILVAIITAVGGIIASGQHP